MSGSEPSVRSVAVPITASARLIVTQPVKHGHDEEIRRWQAGVNRAVAGFPGFLGAEVGSGTAGEEWTALYRFDSRVHLESWLKSATWANALKQGGDLFAGPPTPHILTDSDGENFVSIVVSHPVDPDHEQEFLEWQQRVTEAESVFPGFRGFELLRPAPGAEGSWTAIVRFDTEENLDAWLGSRERMELLKERPDPQFKLWRILIPFGNWVDDRDVPRWKEALTILVGLYPTVVLLTLGIGELWKGGKLWQTLLLGNILSVFLLVFIVTPSVQKALHFWRKPDWDHAGPSRDIAGAVIALAFLAVCALVFWLTTTQI